MKVTHDRTEGPPTPATGYHGIQLIHEGHNQQLAIVLAGH